MDRLRPIVVSILLGAWCSTASAVAGESWDLHFVDDRGRPVEGVLELCLRRGVEQSCRNVELDVGEATAAGGFDALWAEGPSHGPVDLGAGELGIDDDGRRSVELPRKASVRVKYAADRPRNVAFSLYRRDDRTFRRPVRRVLEPDPRGVLVPAGTHLVSVAAAGCAPYLSHLAASPGEEVTLEPACHPGWSLLLRAVDASTGDSVPGVEVEVAGAHGFSPPAPSRSGEGDEDGLVIVNALDLPLAAADLRAPAFLPAHVPALAATPGTFAFHEVALHPGGAMDAEVRLRGEPATGADCRLLRFARPVPSPDAPPPETVAEVEADGDGRCRLDRLAPGRYALRVDAVDSVAGRRAEIYRAVDIEDRQTVEVVADLLPSTLHGRVLRGDEPAPGYRLVAYDRAAAMPFPTDDDAAATAHSDEEGIYELTVWSDGVYDLYVLSDRGTPAAVRTVEVSGDETYDVHLAAHAVTGRVVDADGGPVAEAGVALRWKAGGGPVSGRLARTADDGSFELPLDDGRGLATVRAGKAGYRSSEIEELRLDPEVEPPTLVLRLEPRARLTGTLRSAAGAPVAGAWLASHRGLDPARPLPGVTEVGRAVTDADGRFDLPLPAAGPAWIFFGGPGCPLATRVLPERAAASQPRDLACAASPAHVELVLKDALGAPWPGGGVLLRSAVSVIPASVLVRHLGHYGLPAVSDAGGRLTLVALEPGDYELYLASATSPVDVLSGVERGRLGPLHLPPSTSVGLEVAVTEQRPAASALPRPAL